ncbi:SDR family NAD(P)-dependent oxidoreductase [Boseongicola sp. H5]|nr:SDR family NAD(P)-dependent oxidoreductase [Boseongicola sp. H5]
MPNCFIVGVGPGLSDAMARRFAAGGYAVGLVARGASHIRSLAEELSQDARSAWLCADAGDAEALVGALSDLEDRIGPPDVLIYNPSVMRAEGPLNLPIPTLRNEFEVNVIGALACAQHVAPGMKSRGRGTILFTGGGLALEPYPEWTSLALGKAALRSLSFSLFKDLAPHGVHVAVIAVCGIVEPGGPFDPGVVAEEYWRLTTAPEGLNDREIIFQPQGTDPFYNDPERRHEQTTVPPRDVP